MTEPHETSDLGLRLVYALITLFIEERRLMIGTPVLADLTAERWYAVRELRRRGYSFV